MADEQQPWVRVERGSATEEEVAALVAALSLTRAGAGGGPGPQPVSAWVRAARTWQRTPDSLPPPGPGAWRLSGLPTRR